MIDLRKVEPLESAHLYFDREGRRWNLSCKEMHKDENNLYHCANNLCRLVYRHFIFVGYLKNPDLPYSVLTRLENISDKPMVCRPQCAFLKLNDSNGFYACVNCGGNFMKHPELGVTSIPADWLQQNPRVLKYFILKAQESAKAFRKDLAKCSNPEVRKRLSAPYEEAEKIFVTEILSRCRL